MFCILYSVFVIYWLVRFFLLGCYEVVNKNIWRELDREEEQEKTREFSLFLNPSRASVAKWRKLYEYDSRVKRTGSLLLALFPFILFYYRLITETDPSQILQLVTYPVLVQISNIAFEPFEIDRDMLIQDMYHERFLARHRHKNN